MNASITAIDLTDDSDPVVPVVHMVQKRKSKQPKQEVKKPKLNIPEISDETELADEGHDDNDDMGCYDEDDDCKSNEIDFDECLDQIFKISEESSKKTVPKIKQIFQTRNKKQVKKITSPGEVGRYMIKIEMTDCWDLKGCNSSKTYWTKIARKAVFLTDIKDPILKSVESILLNVGKGISNIPETEVDVVDVDPSK